VDGWILSRQGTLTKRARLAPVTTTTAAEAVASPAAESAAAVVAAASDRGRRWLVLLDAGGGVTTTTANPAADWTRAGTPVGRHDGVADPASEAGARGEAGGGGQGGTAGGQVDGAVVEDLLGPCLLLRQLLPPVGVSMEQPQDLLGHTIMRHFVFVFAPLLGESTRAVMDPFITILLFAPTTSVMVVLVASHGAGGCRSTVEAAGLDDEGARGCASGRAGRGVDGRRVDNRVDPELLVDEIARYQPSEFSLQMVFHHDDMCGRAGRKARSLPRDRYWQ
jgi:hypothetical protein